MAFQQGPIDELLTTNLTAKQHLATSTPNTVTAASCSRICPCEITAAVTAWGALAIAVLVHANAVTCNVAVTRSHTVSANTTIVFMISNVCLQVALLREALPADGTWEGFLSIMWHPMDLKVTDLWEWFLANVTRVRLIACMWTLMDFQITFLRERFVACFACERFLTWVYTMVVL